MKPARDWGQSRAGGREAGGRRNLAAAALLGLALAARLVARRRAAAGAAAGPAEAAAVAGIDRAGAFAAARRDRHLDRVGVRHLLAVRLGRRHDFGDRLADRLLADGV